MLYSERKRLSELKVLESQGKSLWSKVIPSAFRIKLKNLVGLYGSVANPYDEHLGLERIFSSAQLLITRETGVLNLQGHTNRSTDFVEHIMSAENEDYPNILEALCAALEVHANDNEKVEVVVSFEKHLNNLLESYRVGYTVENKQVVPFESKELHASIVVPALHLLNQPGWEPVEQAYQDSLKELSAGNTQNAITDATTALQEALRKAGCKGDNFQSLLKSAESSILKGYDAKYMKGLESLIDWASASRANKGDSHKVTEAKKEDAWFVIHLVGILLMRLSKIDP